MSRNFTAPRRGARLARLALPTMLIATSAGGAAAAAPDLALVEQPGQRFERSIEIHRAQSRYEDLRAEAEHLDVAPAEDVAERRSASADEYATASSELRERIEKERERRAAKPDFGLAGGVSPATLATIASCESGGDYSTNTGNGFYGAYQFDQGTWESVGGSGLPSDASPAEQDYRASLLYAEAGSSPWPVCGV